VKPSRRRGHLVAAQHEADLKTIADFRRFGAAFRRSCCCAGGSASTRQLLAGDGTRIKAVNDKDRNFTCGSLREYIRADEPLEIVSRGVTRVTSRMAQRSAGCGRKISPRRSKPCAGSATVYEAMPAQLDRTSPAMAAHTGIAAG
jgi:hypothetical protein